MARYLVPQFSEFPYHITGRCQSKMAFPISLDKTWDIFQEELFLSHVKSSLKVHAFVLMPNHFHLLASISDVSIGNVLQELMGHTGRRINKEANAINHLWGSRAFRCLIQNNAYYSNVYRYVYQNPLRAQLVNKCESWPYSTLAGLTGNRHLFIPMTEDTNLFDPHFKESTLDWLNIPLEEKKLVLIRKGLKKKIFKVSASGYKKDPLLDF